MGIVLPWLLSGRLHRHGQRIDHRRLPGMAPLDRIAAGVRKFLRRLRRIDLRRHQGIPVPVTVPPECARDSSPHPSGRGNCDQGRGKTDFRSRDGRGLGFLLPVYFELLRPVPGYCHDGGRPGYRFRFRSRVPQQHGRGVGATASTFGVLNDTAKWMLWLAMLLGRLEVFPLLLLFSRDFWRWTAVPSFTTGCARSLSQHEFPGAAPAMRASCRALIAPQRDAQVGNNYEFSTISWLGVAGKITSFTPKLAWISKSISRRSPCITFCSSWLSLCSSI